MHSKPLQSVHSLLFVGEFLVAAPVVAIVTLLLWQFADLLWAEHLLHRAATAAAREATLPQATPRSIAAAAGRVLRETRLEDVADFPLLTINGRSVLHSRLDVLKSGDQVEVTIGAYATEVVPDALAAVGLSLSTRKLRATASFTKR